MQEQVQSMGHAQAMSQVRVLVFGATGVGKTSLCNVLCGRERAADNGPLGVTTKSHLHVPFEWAGRSIEVIDTAGLHESIHGTVPPEVAVQQLTDLLDKSRDGFSLLIHVARAGRITQAHDEDHDFFVNRFIEGKIPVMLAVTGCENEQDMADWPSHHAAAFERFGYAAIVPGCYAKGGRFEEAYQPLREESRLALLQAIEAHALREPRKLFGGDTGQSLTDVLGRVWNRFVEIAGLPARYRKDLNTGTVKWLRRIGVPKEVADSLAMHIPELAQELGDRFIPIPFGGKVFKALAQSVIERIRRPQA